MRFLAGLLALGLLLSPSCGGDVPITFSPEVVDVWPGGLATLVVAAPGGFDGDSTDYTLTTRGEAGAALSVQVVDLHAIPLGGGTIRLSASIDAPEGTFPLEVELLGKGARYLGVLQVVVHGNGETDAVDAGEAPPDVIVDPPFLVDAGSPEPMPPDDAPDAG